MPQDEMRFIMTAFVAVNEANRKIVQDNGLRLANEPTIDIDGGDEGVKKAIEAAEMSLNELASSKDFAKYRGDFDRAKLKAEGVDYKAGKFLHYGYMSQVIRELSDELYGSAVRVQIDGYTMSDFVIAMGECPNDATARNIARMVLDSAPVPL